MQIFILILCLSVLTKFSIIIKEMRKHFIIFAILFGCIGTLHATTRDARLTNTTGYNYNYMYPYMNNQMRTDLNPGTTTPQSLSPINTVVKTTQLGQERKVVPRRGRNNTATTTTARSATTGIAAPGTATRRVVARRATNSNQMARRGDIRGNQMQNVVSNTTSNRTQPTYSNRSAATAIQTTPTERISSTRCLADYTECMNNYCERPNSAYNRCYCSSKLSQIDSQYQPAIEQLITSILTIKSANKWTDNEMNKYWMDTVGKYSNENSWTNLDNALNIDWSSMESRVRGQNAFTTGHEYCVQHLRGCYYMAGNLRDAYRSDIARDCAVYEASLQKIKNAAESIVESYK